MAGLHSPHYAQRYDGCEISRATLIAAAGGAALALLFHQLRRWDDLTGFVVETMAAGLAAGILYFVTLSLIPVGENHLPPRSLLADFSNRVLLEYRANMHGASSLST